MEDIQSLFREHANHFTIYVVEQKFVAGRGYEFFKRYKGQPNYIDTDQKAKSTIMKIYSWINKKIPSLGELIKIGFGELSSASIIDIVIAFSKLFMAQEHQAAGPTVIDPIIIQEGKVLKTYINQLVTVHKNSILAPAIIILLRNNDFDSAKKLLSECPDGIYIKLIRNSGKTELCKVINTGAENIEGFITSFSQQCFNTCSNTRHEILLNEEWAEDSLTKKYAPQLLKFRADLLCDEKNEISTYLSNYIMELQSELNSGNIISSKNITLIKNFLGVAKIFRIFCNDNGGNDMVDTLSLAKETENEILKAGVYKCAYFFHDKTIREQDECLEEAYRIFVKNEMADNAIYCKNNRLVRQFDTDRIRSRDFADIVGEATSDVPGLVGMPHIFNNAGMAFMMTAQPDLAMEYFDNGLEYTKSPERFVQKIAILCNKMITKSYYNDKVEYSEIEKLLIQIFDGMVKDNKLPFIAARYVMNLLIIAAREDMSWIADFLENYAIIDLFNQGMNSNSLGTGQLLMQLDYIDQKLPQLNIKSSCIIPKDVIYVTGNRKRIIQNSGLNPFYFCTWL